MNNEAREGSGASQDKGSCFKKVREAFPRTRTPTPPHVLFCPSLSWPVNISAHSWISVKPCHLPVLAKTGPVHGSLENWVSKMTNPKMTGPQPTFSKCPLLRTALFLKSLAAHGSILQIQCPQFPLFAPTSKSSVECLRTGNFHQQRDFWFWSRKERKTYYGISPVVQWVRTRLPVQRTRVRSLAQKDPTHLRAAKPVRHSTEPFKAREPQILSPCAATTEGLAPEPTLWTREDTAASNPRTTAKSSPRSPQLGKAHSQQQRPSPAKNK